jgi:1-acyl-sn-glycerol-3-phosphate acyltransferase
MLHEPMADLPPTSSLPIHRRIRRLIGRTWLWAFGFELDGGSPGVDKAVVVAYPHTSNWDLLFTLAAAYVLDVDVNWLGKKSLFRAPYGWWMRFVGGIAVDRSRSTRLVDAIVEAIEPRDHVMVIIPPEGTRSKSGRWKSGFYWVAVGAQLPIVLGFVDYGRKRAGLGEVFTPSGDLAADFDKIRAFYQDIEGKHPELQGEITLDLDEYAPE